MATDTAANDAPASQRDFEELHEDVSGSPLWNRDLAPTTIRERTWTTWNIAALWIGMSVVITTYTLAGGFVEQGMNWWQAMVTILLGNTVVLVPMILNAHAGTKYGISFPVLCRSSFGTRGANVPAVLRAIVACGWFGIQTWIGGDALDRLFAAMWGGWAGLGGGAQVFGVAVHTWIAFFLFWLIEVLIIVKGIEGIKHLETWSAPLLLGGGAALLAWAAWRAGGLGRVLTESAALQKEQNSFWAIFPGALTASVGYWATLSLNIPDFTRYARSQRSQMLGQALGLPLTMTAFAFIGVAVTSATLLIYGRAIPNPVELMSMFDSVAVILFATVVIFAAQLSTNMAANVVSPSNDFSNLKPRLISYVTGGLITAVLGVMMMPWKLMSSAGSYIFTWLVGYSALMGAIGGIMICDYWVLRRRRLDLAELYRPSGRYSYTNGYNWRALVAFTAAVAPVVPGFLRAATTPNFTGKLPDPALSDTLYTYAWFVTFGIGFFVYYVLMNGHKSLKEE